jgi:hypothetical protein
VATRVARVSTVVPMVSRQTKARPGTLTLQFTDDDGAHWTLKSTTAKKAQFASCDQCKQWLRSPYWPPATLAAMHERGTGHKADFWAIAKVTPRPPTEHGDA